MDSEIESYMKKAGSPDLFRPSMNGSLKWIQEMKNAESEEDQVRRSFDVLFYKPRKGELAGPLSAQIYVKSAGPDETGHIFITRRCDYLTEFEQQIDRLQTELEAIRKEAKKRFEKDR